MPTQSRHRFKTVLLVILGFAAILSAGFWWMGKDAPGPVPQSGTLISPMKGIISASDGVFHSPEIRQEPSLRTPLVKEARWSLPEEVFKITPFPHVLVLRNTDIDAGAGPAQPPPSPGINRWQIVVGTGKSSKPGGIMPKFFRNSIGDSDATLELQYLAGPQGSPKTEILWNGKTVATLDCRAETWEIRTVQISAAGGEEEPNILECVERSEAGFDPKIVTPGFFLAAVKIPAGWDVLPESVQVETDEGAFLLGRTPGGQPVRLWTIGQGTGANPEFCPVAEQPNLVEKVRSIAREHLIDAGLGHVHFPVQRNADGSQEADFRKAVCILTVPGDYQVGSEHSQATALTIEFDSPVDGEARLIGRAKISGKWSLSFNGQPVETANLAAKQEVKIGATDHLPPYAAGAKPSDTLWKPVEIEGIHVQKGRNTLTLTAISGRSVWDYFGLDLMDSQFLNGNQGAKGLPVSPPDAERRNNPEIAFDPAVSLQTNGEERVENSFFGVTDHNPPSEILKTPALFESVKSLGIGTAKGPDHLIFDTSPQAAVAGIKGLEAHYASDRPVTQYQTLFNEAQRGWKRRLQETTRALQWDRIAVLSGIPTWAQLPRGKGHNQGVPSDPDVSARIVSGGLETAKSLWPEISSGYLWNEPDAWWKWEKEILESKNMGYADYFRNYLEAVRGQLDQKIPGFQLGVPSTYAPPINSIGNTLNLEKWRIWWEPLIRESWEHFDFFDFHAYGFDPRQILANLDLLAAAGVTLHGQRKPVAMTEVGYAESLIQRVFGIQDEPACWRYRSLPYARFLIACAAEPDRIRSALYYDLCNHEYGIYRMGGMEPTSMADVFQALAPVRGKILGAQSTDPELTWLACRNENTVNVAIVTGERNGGAIILRMPENLEVSARVQRLALNDQLSNVVITEFETPIIDGVLNLPPMPGSLITVSFETAAASKDLVRERREFFAKGFAELLDLKKTTATWTIECPDHQLEGDWALRIGTFGPASLEFVDFLWNGEPLEVQGRFRSEIALPKSKVKAMNIFEARLRGEGATKPLLLGSVSLMLTAPAQERQCPDEQRVKL